MSDRHFYGGIAPVMTYLVIFTCTQIIFMRKFTILSLLLLCCFTAMAQFIDKTITERPIPPSPAASSLLQFVDMPVGHYTGTTQVSIPIYEIKGKDISLPISLS